MKKNVFCISYAVAMYLFVSTANAQTPDHQFVAKSIQPGGQPERVTNYINDVNVRAVRDFSKSFRHAENESWSIEKEGYRVSFYQDGIHYLVDYTKKGNWRNTIRILHEKNLPDHIRWAVRTTFLDYSIVTATELQYGRVLAYFIKLEDEKHLKTVRVMNDEIEVVEEYTK